MFRPLPRPTYEQIVEVAHILRHLESVEFETQADALVTVWLPVPRGGVQPVFWPMRLLPPQVRSDA